MKENYDIIIIGAGPVGCTIAERCANELGWNVLLIDKRAHIAGNCYDEKHSSGVLIHKYGPHYFRTNKKPLIDYLSQFTEWIEGDYIVKSQIESELYPFPINLNTLREFFKQPFDAEGAQQKLAEVSIPNKEPKNSEEYVLSKVGRALYEAFYLGYTQKQWGLHPSDLAPGVCGRIPVRFSEDPRYVDHAYQLMPKDGYTSLFSKMIKNDLIDVQLNTDFSMLTQKQFTPQAMVYTGPIDAYFDYQFGKLAWRSLQFEFKEFPKEFKQPCVQINYPNQFDFTRSVEIKHITKQKTKNTVICYEYPKASGAPFYPIPNSKNQERYLRYQALAAQETKQKNVHFCGRLATYRYINTDEAIEQALATFEKIKRLYQKSKT